MNFNVLVLTSSICFLFTQLASAAGGVSSIVDRSRDVTKISPAGLNSICREMGIEARDTNGKWFCLSLDFASKSDQLSTLKVLQSSLDLAQKNDSASTYLYRLTGNRNHGFHVKSVKLIKK